MSTTTWTPRPLSPDEPACWSWEIPPSRSREEELAELVTRFGQGGADLILRGRGGGDSRWASFHDGRCAICAIKGEHLVDDHCHETGQVRGRLCRSCNIQEGMSGGPVLIRYRRIHPAAILGHYVMYTGIGWDMGWPYSDGRAWELGRRPRTEWPPWTPELGLDERYTDR